VQDATDIRGRAVLTAYAPVAPLGWLVFVELPAEEAYAPLWAAIERAGALLFAGLTLAFLAGVFLARRMVGPIQALRRGAARIGSGDLTQRISIKTGDELEALADQFNDMAGKLEESYADLEQKVEDRTRELSEALDQQTATSEVLRVISSSPGDLNPVYQTMLKNALRICEASFGNLFLREGADSFRMVADHSDVPANTYSEWWRREPVIALHDNPRNPLAQISASKGIVQIADLRLEPAYKEGNRRIAALVESAGARTLLGVPMLKENEVIGAIVIYRQEVRSFTDKQIALVTNFASQAVIAIENMRLLSELRARTDELAQSVGELRALGETSQAVNSTLDMESVLNTIVTKAVQLSGTDAGTIYVHEGDGEFKLRSTYGMTEELIAAIQQQHVGISEALNQATQARQPEQVADLRDLPPSPAHEIVVRAGYRARLIVPLLGVDSVVGALVVRRKEPGDYSKSTVDLLQTFSAQSVLAIQNARLFLELREKGQQLEIASQHKSQFLANMSHELRTPLNAILGYTELIIDDIYGETPAKMRSVLDRVQRNGKHLLGLINDVLDLSKIEAGQLTLSLNDYSIKDIVHSVFAAVESLATEKRLALKVDLPPDLPAAHGDERRLTQVLLNLVGNAIKFTDSGEVKIKAAAANGAYTLSVRDTGPGIDPSDQVKIFQEFQQADSSATKKKGGTGLGLAIARRIIEMHGGRLWVESAIGHGATFSFTVPIQVEQQAGQT